MATEYMDYGYFKGEGAPAPTPVSTVKNTQVYMATHRGDEKLPYRYRSFISFKYGGRDIEDFNLVATVNGDRMTKSVSADFEDLTSSTDVLNGQYYHGTHYKVNTLSFTLSTDSMDQRMLEEFKNWFRGGTARPLILAEHPNREIIARIAQPPEINMLPFEKEVTLNIASTTYTTSVTEYKGDISLDFIMDEPFWYSKVNIFGNVQNGTYIDSWEGVEIFNGSSTVQDELKDVLKMIYEDGIPVSSMISEPMLFGNEIYATEGNIVISSICQPCDPSYLAANGNVQIQYDTNTGEVISLSGGDPGYYYNGDSQHSDDSYYYPAPEDPDNPDAPPANKYYYGAVIEENNVSIGTKGTIFGPFIKSARGAGLNFLPGEENAFNLYYAGTAPSPVLLNFTIPITLDGFGYVASIGNAKHFVNNKPYSSMFLRCLDIQEMRFTTPNFLTSYNKVIELFSNYSLIGNYDWEKLLGEVRDKIRHATVRKLAAIIINKYSTMSTTVGNYYSSLVNDMKAVLNGDNCTLSVQINSRTGEATGRIRYVNISYNNNTLVTSSYATLEENVGDMISSNHLTLEDRNYFNKDTYTIMAWKADAPSNSYKLYHNFPETLTGFSIEYKYMYY